MRFIPWHEDKWLSKQGNILVYDKLEHFLLTLTGTVVGAFISVKWAVIMVLLLGLAWEIRDGYFSHGFSWKDLLANLFGVLAGVLVYDLI